MSRRTNEPRAGTGTDEQQTPESSGKLMQVLSIGVAAIAVLCTVLFFQLDIPNKIATAKAMDQYAAQNQMNTAQGDSPSQPEIDENGSGTIGGDSPELNDGETPTQDDGASEPEPTVSLTPTDVVDPTELADYLRDLPAGEFQKITQSLTATTDSTNAPVDFKTLEAAYAEAEAKYPGQIDASKRLKLIAEINAIDYLYYIAEDGDTLLELSKAFNVPLGQLVEMNGIKDADKIPAGMIILFPTDTKQ